jgi:hypothetical protein
MKTFNTGTREGWVEFLTAKGFKMIFQDEWVCVFKGGQPCIKVMLSDTVHKCFGMINSGTICADFDCLFNKPSTCPIYFSDNANQEEFWNAIELLMGAGIGWSRRYRKN